MVRTKSPTQKKDDKIVAIERKIVVQEQTPRVKVPSKNVFYHKIPSDAKNFDHALITALNVAYELDLYVPKALRELSWAIKREKKDGDEKLYTAEAYKATSVFKRKVKTLILDLEAYIETKDRLCNEAKKDK